MLTVMCPNCRHRFPAPGCCNPGPQIESATMQSLNCGGNYYSCGGLLVPRGYNTGGGCFINAPTIIHGPAIIQSNDQNGTNKIDAGPFGIFGTDQLLKNQEKNIINLSGLRSSSDCQINTTCDLTGGTVTITTPKIQSGGCLIQSTDSGTFIQAPKIEIRPKLSGGGCCVQKKLSTEDSSMNQANFTDNGCVDTLSDVKYFENCPFTGEKLEDLILPPSGCQELPGIRRNSNVKSPMNHLPFGNNQNKDPIVSSNDQKPLSGCCCNSRPNSCHSNLSANTCQTSTSTLNGVKARKSSSTDDPGAVQIQVNATIQLPPNVGQCTVNITAMTNPNIVDGGVSGAVRSKNNFNGGGLVQMDGNPTVYGENERREDAPTTPVSWLMPFPWGFDTYPQDKDLVKLAEIKRLLHTSGWYHEGLGWQQSENLLKNVPIGRWLMRDSSDSRYTFAVSVQTNRGPTSVRVHYFFGQFRLDAEPRLVLAMPLFDCPIKMLEYYVDYSRIEENRREVWVDYSGQLYSQIFLTRPLIKQVRPLSHLARLAVNKNKLNTDHLPAPIKNYLAEYPYSF